jgi:hypothetical protein
MQRGPREGAPLFRSVQKKALAYWPAAVRPIRTNCLRGAPPVSWHFWHFGMQRPVAPVQASHPLKVMQTLPDGHWSDDEHACGPAQKMSGPHLSLPSTVWKQYAPSPTSDGQFAWLLHGWQPTWQHSPAPLQAFLHCLLPPVAAWAGRLDRTGAAQATAPAIPMLRSISRREIRFSESMFHPLRLSGEVRLDRTSTRRRQSRRQRVIFRSTPGQSLSPGLRSATYARYARGRAALPVQVPGPALLARRLEERS